ncbi:MAG: hypothetical protein IJS59_05815 [Bacteroidaceae bacterium]|nr:hypothetical protein [Bacteroidaceae bacterium]
MNKVLRSALALALACVGTLAWADGNIATSRLQNAGFDDETSWTTENVVTAAEANSLDVAGWVATGAAWSSSAAFGYGTTGQVNGITVPATGPDGTATGGALGVSVGWGGKVTYAQDITLPAGTYVISYKAINLLADATQMTAQITLGDEVHDVATSFTYNSWEENSATFTLDTDVEDAQLSLSFEAVSGGSGSNAKIFVDGLSIVITSIPALDEAVAEWRAANLRIQTLDEEYPGEVLTDAVLAKINEANLLLNGVSKSLEDGTFDLDQAEQDIAAARQLLVDANALADNNYADARSLPSGQYYLKTTYDGRDYYFGPSNSWGTQASLMEHSVVWTLDKLAPYTYTLESVVINGGTDYYFNGTYCDGSATNVYFTEQEDGTFIMSTAEGANYVVVTSASGAANLPVVANSGTAEADALRWSIVPTAVENIKAGDNVTYLIKDADFGRNNRYLSAWNVSEDCTNRNLSGGKNENLCAESYHSTFTISQTIDGVPDGYYTLTAQGFYRQDGSDNEHLPVFFLGDNEIAVPLKTSSENSMNDASTAFANGLYAVALPVRVEGGQITLGIKLVENKSLWVIWDNFGLKYMGDDDTEYVAYNNELPHDELVAALDAVRTAFATAQTTVATYDEFVQNAVKAAADELTVLLQDENVTHEEEVKDEAGEVTGTETVTDQVVVNQKIATAYAEKKCSEQKEALLAEIAAIQAKVDAYAETAKNLQEGNDNSYARMRTAYEALVAQWQTAYDKINTEYKEYIDAQDEKYNGYLRSLSSAYVSVDALDATIEGYKTAGSCEANEAATLAGVQSLSESIAAILETALNSYNSDVAQANAAAYKAVTDLYEEKIALYKAGIVDVSEHYAAVHPTEATAAQVSLFELYDWIMEQYNGATTEYTTIEAGNKTKFDAQNFPLATFDNTTYINNLRSISPENVEAIMQRLETDAAAEHETQRTAFQTTYDALVARCGELEALIAGRNLTAADYAETVAKLEADIQAIQPYLFAPVYNPLTMTFTRRAANNDHITAWSVYGSNDATAADDQWVEIAAFETPFTNNTETLSNTFANTPNYSYLRFYIDATTTGNGFGHASAFQLFNAAGDSLIIDAGQLSSPYTDPSEGSLAALIDGNASTFWHSSWHNGPVANHTHYLQVALPEATHALPHNVAAEDCDVMNAAAIKALLDAFQADIDALETTLDADYSTNLLADIETKLQAAEAAAAAALLPESDNAAALAETFGERYADLLAKTEAIRSEAAAADAAKTLIAEYDAYVARIGEVTDAAATEPDPVVIGMEKGEKAYDATVNGAEAMKLGTGSAAGTMTLTIPAGVSTFSFNAVAWNGETDVELTVGEGDAAQTFTIQGNAAVAGSATDYTFEETDEMTYTYEFAEATTEEVTLTVTAPKRFVIWAVTTDAVGADPSVYAQVNALAADVANEDVKLTLDADIATLSANLTAAKKAIAALKQDKTTQVNAIQRKIKNLTSDVKAAYEAATLVAQQEALNTRVEGIQADIDALMSNVYYADLTAQLAALKTTHNLVYAEVQQFDDTTDSSIDEANDLIQNLEANVIDPLAAACTKTQYEAACDALSHVKDYYTDHAQWIVDEYPLGDANLNHAVTVADAVVAVGAALQDDLQLTPRQWYTTDANKSETITVADAVGIINIALGMSVDNDADVKAAAVSTDRLVIEGNSISLDATDAYVAFQMDIRMHEGARLDGVKLMAEGLTLYTNRLADGTVRVIALSMDNAAMLGRDALLLTVSATGHFDITAAEFVDAKGMARSLNLDGATAIDAIATDATATDIYTVGGVRDSRLRQGVNIVRQADGSVRKVLVK